MSGSHGVVWEPGTRSAPTPERGGGREAYLSKPMTWFGAWLAWPRIAMPACCNTWARVMLAVSEAKSVSWMRLRAALRLVDVACKLDTAELKRFCKAPIKPWFLLTIEIAPSMADKAFCAPDCVETSTAAIAEIDEVVVGPFCPIDPCKPALRAELPPMMMPSPLVLLRLMLPWL